jgi:hypothetical protein
MNPNDPSQGDVQPSSQHAGTGNSVPQRAKEQPVLVTVNSSVSIPDEFVKEYRADQQKRSNYEWYQEERDKTRLKVEKRVARWVAVGTLSAIAAGYFAFQDIRTLQTQLEQSDKQFKESQLSMKDNARDQCRAYVLVKSAQLIEPLTIGRPIAIGYVLKNTGLTPALKVDLQISTYIRADENPTIDLKTDPPRDPQGDIGSGEEVAITYIRTSDVLTKEQYDAVTRGTSKLYLGGFVFYSDVFRKVPIDRRYPEPQTQVCFLYIQKGRGGMLDTGLVPCKRGVVMRH